MIIVFFLENLFFKSFFLDFFYNYSIITQYLLILEVGFLKDIWIIISFIFFIVFISIFLEENYKWARNITGAIISLLLATIFSNLNLIPHSSIVYDNIFDYVVPMSITLLLFNCDLKQIYKESGRLLILFLISSLGSVLGAFLGYVLLRDTIPILASIAGLMTASYVGGSVNFIAVASAFNIPAGVISAATVSDNLLMIPYFLILISIPSAKFFKKNFLLSHANSNEEERKFSLISNNKSFAISLRDFALSFSVSSIIVTISFTLADFLKNFFRGSFVNIFSNKYLVLATVTIIFTTIFSEFFKNIKSSNMLGTFLIYVFFTVMGSQASIISILENSPLIFLFCLIIVSVNMFITFLAAKIFNFTLEEAIIASNANIGGATTAVALASSKGWKNLLAPSILVGTFGYIIGTYLGLFVGQILM